MDISKMSKLELLNRCEELQIMKCKGKNKSQLIELINSKNNNLEDNIADDIINVNIKVCAGGKRGILYRLSMEKPSLTLL